MAESIFICHKCGKETICAPDPPAVAVCPECCEDHNFIYSRSEREHYCEHCGVAPPDDWYEVDYEMDMP